MNKKIRFVLLIMTIVYMLFIPLDVLLVIMIAFPLTDL